MTLRELIRETERRLRAAQLHYGHGTDNAHDEAAWLVLRGLELSFDADLRQPADPRRIEHLVRKRIRERVPLAYLLGEAWLDGVPFCVDRRVIIPRSHIPFVVKRLRVAPGRILDLCTGSGCLAILAARAFPRARVDAADIAASALAVARKNVSRHGLQERIRLVRSDLFSSLGHASYDLIVANPPYVTTAAMRTLPPEYRYEPGIALAAGRDGLELVSRIIAEAPARLNPRGILVCEVGGARAALERAYPRLPLRWPQPEVFTLAAPRRPPAFQMRAMPARAPQ
ncbi:MAG TPA: 50S ribosomal protein L3 N(5)-glutamine methyltransferase [Burkholderiales bacterium]|nr:50S ribosomal protein L3 N(5)-glutamine methyltransferase [Burkholderiales bacterium]